VLESVLEPLVLGLETDQDAGWSSSVRASDQLGETRQAHNKAFDSIDALEDQLQTGLLALDNDMLRFKSIVAWNWIVDALST
jgi:hypothetical protein